MSKLINLSESSLIAMHSLALIAKNMPEPLSAKHIAKVIGASLNTVSKVMQRLVKTGYIQSLRGPFGGFILGKESEEISLLDIYEAIEGKLVLDACPFNKTDCVFGECIFGDFMKEMSLEFKNMFAERKLSDYL